jgi:predicted metal-dependent enzyme (double-stranded beta helix superfamily)
MGNPSGMPEGLLDLCSSWSEELERLTDSSSRIRCIRDRLPELLEKQPLFIELLRCIGRGCTYPDIRHTDAFENEILLYLNPKRIFSLRMFLFGPGEFTPVHDHNSWGVVGTAMNRLTVVKYVREDDGSLDGHARVHPIESLTLDPGDTDITLPLNDGIHKTGNEGKNPVIMVNVYGSPIRRLFVHGFEIEKNRVYRMYAPRMKKKLLAREALANVQC